MYGKHINTPKIGRHTTFTDKSYGVVQQLIKIDEVRKVYGDRMRRGRPVSQHSIKVKLWQEGGQNQGLRLCVRGSTSIQDVRVVTEFPQLVINFLLEKFPGGVRVSKQVFRDIRRIERDS